MDKSQALYSFWMMFGWDVYDENTIPTGDDAPTTPYITYSTITDSLDSDVYPTASLWDRGMSWERISKKAEEIAEYIEKDFRPIQLDGGGYFWISKGSPFAQRMSDDDDTIRRILLNLKAEFLTAY